MTLRIDSQSSVIIEGFVDGEDLRFVCGGVELAKHDNQLELVGVEQARVLMRVPDSIVQVQHEDDDGTRTWSRVEDGFESTLVATTDPTEVDAAGKGNTPHATIHIKLTPKGGLPDR
ncbi:MAG: hypothetical protein H6712_23220 [Myxococcales bacterium]|nr:hypothetical protein [Myxococcales bacterium]MCB9716788.1 hypothetical protein [Myxococcales bacterium]